jgi:uncharacterized protein (TIGR02246 family)
MTYRFWKSSFVSSLVLGMASFAVAQDTTNKPATATTPATTVVAKPVSPEQLALETDAVKAIKQLTDALNAGNSDAVAGVFLPDGELIDDSGTVHLGHEEIKALVKAFQETYPGSKTDAQVESVRAVAGLVLVDGTRVITGKDGGSLSVIRFATIWKKTDAGLKLASLRDVSEALPPTPHEALEGLAWIVGEWINESGESKVSLNYRWDDNGNFIVGDINITSGDQVIMKSFQRIAWDASQGKYRSWTFDSDGGFGEGVWNATPNGLVLQNSAVGPDGLRGTATVKLVSDSKDRFTIQGIHRISEGMEAPDYQYTVVRKPPVAK